MNRVLFLALVASAAVAGYLVADPPVNLQASSPGTQQTGNVNISGTMIAGKVSATNSGATAQVIVGDATATSGANFGGLFKTASTTGTGVRGVATATSGGGNGGTFQTAATTGAGVRGFATSATGENFGVFGQAASPTGFAGFFQGRLQVTGNALFGGLIEGDGSALSNMSANNITQGLLSSERLAIPLSLEGTSDLVTFQASNTVGSVALFAATKNTGSVVAVRAFTQAPTGVGLEGSAFSSTGANKGVFGQTASATGTGVFGEANSLSGAPFGVRGRSVSAGGMAAFFQNLGAGSTHDVEISGPRGAINTKGFVYREYAGLPVAAIPVAYGSVSSTGTINGGTGNFTVNTSETGKYDVTIVGETYSNSTFSVSITPVSNSPRFATVADGGAPFRVNMWTSAGVLVDSSFQFTIWAVNPGPQGRRP